MPGTYLGPVHDVEVSSRFVSIRIPHPEMRDVSTWTNIWKPAILMALPVQKHTLQGWTRAGWRNYYVQDDA